jgi:hypothetical protein
VDGEDPYRVKLRQACFTAPCTVMEYGSSHNWRYPDDPSVTVQHPKVVFKVCTRRVLSTTGFSLPGAATRSAFVVIGRPYSNNWVALSSGSGPRRTVTRAGKAVGQR